MVTPELIKQMARTSAVQLTLASGSRIVVTNPDSVWTPPGAGFFGVSPDGSTLKLIDRDELAEVKTFDPDPEVEVVRAGKIPPWIRNRMKDFPELFVRVSRLDPDKLERILNEVEDPQGRG